MISHLFLFYSVKNLQQNCVDVALLAPTNLKCDVKLPGAQPSWVHSWLPVFLNNTVIFVTFQSMD